MLIRRIEIKNFRKLIGPIVIDGLKQGINIISGDNEEGKSTLLLALRSAFCQKHNTSAQSVKSFQPYNSAVRPEVHVDFELPDGSYKISKGFSVKPQFAEFRSPTGRYEGSEAEEQIRELFKLPLVDKGKKASEADPGLWGLLWLDQATAEDGLATTEYGKEGLTKLLEADVASIVGGPHSRAIVRNIEEEYLQRYTQAQAKERGELKEQRGKRDQCELKYNECLERFEQYKKKSTQLAEKQDALAAHRRNKTVETAQKELEETEKLLQQLRQLRLQVDTVNKAEQVAQLEYNSAADKCIRRIDLVSRRDKITRRLDDLEKLLQQSQEKLSKAEASEKAAKSDLDQAEEQSSAIEARCTEAEQIEQIDKLTDQIKTNNDQIIATESVQKLANELTSELENNRVGGKVLADLRKLEQDKDHTAIRARAMTTRLTVRPKASQAVFIEQSALVPGEELELTKPSTLRLEGWGEIDITPGGEDTEVLISKAKQAAELLRLALQDLDLSSVKDAEELASRRAEIVSELEHHKKTIAGSVGAEGLAALKKKHQSLQTQLDKLCETVDREQRLEDPLALKPQQSLKAQAAAKPSKDSKQPKALQLNLMHALTSEKGLASEKEREDAVHSMDSRRWSEAANAEQQSLTLAELRQRRVAIALQLKTLRLSADQLNTDLAKINVETAGHRSEKDSLALQLADVNRELSTLGTTEESEKQAVSEAQGKLLLAQKDLMLKTHELETLEKAAVETRHKTAANNVTQIAIEIKSLNDTVTQLSAEINAAGDAGLGEELERLEGEKSAATQALNRIEQHAKALKLLYETLTEAQQQAKEQFLEPVSLKLQPHLDRLFAKGTLAIESESMEITHFTRDGLDERYNDLSIGTREQLSVLTRLAVAQLLREKQQPSIVILDDALVYTDDTRMDKIKEILMETALDLQVIILTCKLRDYQDLPNANYISLRNHSAEQVIRSSSH